MMNSSRALIAASVLAALSLPLAAQTLKGVTVEPAAAKVNEPVKITAVFDLGDTPNCAVKVHFGDGASTTGKINQKKDATFSATHAYAKPGSYTVMVEPKRTGVTLKCLGENARATLSVTTPAPKAAAAAPVTAAAPKAPSCPEGWMLDTKSVKSKTGAFRCTAKPGTPVPATKLTCPGQLNYVENSKKGVMACQP